MDKTILFPKVDECKHFHYENCHFSEIKISLIGFKDEEKENNFVLINVLSNEKTWNIKRMIKDLKELDFQIHYCLYSRKYSKLIDNRFKTKEQIEDYLKQFLIISNNFEEIKCSKILNWFELDSKGQHLIGFGFDSDLNLRSIRSAFVIKQNNCDFKTNSLDLEIGEFINILEMPQNHNIWKGKKGFQVGYFPSNCVQLIDSKNINFMTTHTTKNGKISNFFKSFKNKSHSNEEKRNKLKIKGILRERVFGCDLCEYLYNSGQEIPLVLEICSKFIERKGLKVNGIYRLSGISSNIQKLRLELDSEMSPDLYSKNTIYGRDIHCVSSVLKLYFRELPNPLLTYQLYQQFIESVREKKFYKIKELIESLPEPHYRTVKALIKHLFEVSKHELMTGMNAKNLAIVWAPNLLRSKQINENSLNSDLIQLQNLGIQALLTEYLIKNFELIFETKVEMNFSQNEEIDSKLALKPKKEFKKLLSQEILLSQTNRKKDSFIIRSKSFESFFGNHLKLNFAKIDFISNEVLIETMNNFSENELILKTTRDEKSLISYSTVTHSFDQILVKNSSNQLRNDCLKQFNKTQESLSRERIEKIKEKRRQQLRQQFIDKNNSITIKTLKTSSKYKKRNNNLKETIKIFEPNFI